MNLAEKCWTQGDGGKPYCDEKWDTFARVGPLNIVRLSEIIAIGVDHDPENCQVMVHLSSGHQMLWCDAKPISAPWIKKLTSAWQSYHGVPI